MPPTSDPDVTANRKRWVDFVRTDLGTALQEYDSAPTVGEAPDRHCDRIHDSLGTLSAGNQKQPWWPSSELEAAVNELFNRPNLDIAADVEHRCAALQRQPGRRPGRSSAKDISLRSRRARRRVSV